jgi:hypothetical protein
MAGERDRKMTNPQEWKLFRDRVLESAKAIFAPHGTPAGFPSGWQTGLIIDPGSFSEQLNRLQYSLHRANQPVIDQETAEAVAVARKLG